MSTVNPRLTAKRSGRVVENDAYHAFLARAIRAYGRRVAEGDVEAITQLVALANHLDQAIATAINGLRRWGYSWADIAHRLGITRQAAQQRWGAATELAELLDHITTTDQTNGGAR